MQGLLLLLACVNIKSNKYFTDCYRNLINIVSLLDSLPPGYRVRGFFCFARLAVVPILISTSPMVWEKLSCVFMTSERRLQRCTQDNFALMSPKLGQMCPDDLPIVAAHLWLSEVGCLAGGKFGKSFSGRAVTRNPWPALGAVVALQ